MNLHRAHTEILILAVAAVMVLLVSIANAPEQKVAVPQVSTSISTPIEQSPAKASPAALRAVPASLHTVSASTAHSEDDWVRADSVQAPAKQTRWVF
ncbi:hypothetical protein Pstr01_39240 [Pseudomonas straminea]|uniref:Uncharacterized protein n=1 Tax=Pseudomonas straminea TaxID=47882 RepID=A0A1I1YE12_PSEOC|nr:hypothetical protein [Pseudomonas straminea]GLX15685.1 hypothetical protein Pstr01_39240 [Pseudomonas straminea]SFE17781.1 hypothetical protein SAMN05216372_110147 [Pseudomonas straminea]